ncbi:YciI family protein [Xanthobacter sp. V4C-4]|uniref:YciI family protein n=1 Tax=Xanthobacter cornucopiae TaxID=3119924 RepID=UPI00372C36F5
MPHFLLRLTPPRPSFPSDAREAELDAMVAHGAFWQGEADAGRALAVGPVADPAGIWGLALVEVADEAAAEALAAADPVITANLGFTYGVMPLLSLITRRVEGTADDTPILRRADGPADDSHIPCRAERPAPADI